MDNWIRRHWERRQRMGTFFNRPATRTLLQAQADIAADVATFLTDATAWEARAVEIEGLEANANAATKKAAFKTMAEVVSRWGQRCVVKLRRLGLMNEAALADVQPSDFYGMPDAQAVSVAKAISAMLRTNIAALAGQGITAAVITDIDAKINAADALRTRPATAVNDLEAKKAALAAGDATLEAQLEDIVNTLHAEYRYTNADFDRALMEQYGLGGDTGRRYTALEGTARSHTAVLRGYTVRREDDHEKAGVVDMEGRYAIRGMRSGEVVFELVDLAGNVVATKLLKMKLGTVVVWDWVV